MHISMVKQHIKFSHIWAEDLKNWGQLFFGTGDTFSVL